MAATAANVVDGFTLHGAGGTPGAANTVAATDIAPLIRNVEHFPLIPTSTDEVTVVAKVQDELATGLSVVLSYRDDGDPALLERRWGAGQALLLTAGWQPDDSQLARTRELITGIDTRIDVEEKVVNSDGYHCEAGTEDGFAVGDGDRSCAPHASDYAAQDWLVSLSELLRVIQFFNSDGYHVCPEGEDGYCPGPA